MILTHHAIQRFQQRVSDVAADVAARRLQQAVAQTRGRPTPRWWTPVKPKPGLLFIYPATLPGVCLVAYNGAVVTVFVRSQCLSWTRDAQLTAAPAVRRRAPYRRPSPGTPFAEAA